MKKKYKLTDKTKIYNGKTLYRIEALKDFDFIHKGEVGGFVESENNLSQENDCWIGNDAMVFDDARVSDTQRSLKMRQFVGVQRQQIMHLFMDTHLLRTVI